MAGAAPFFVFFFFPSSFDPFFFFFFFFFFASSSSSSSISLSLPSVSESSLPSEIPLSPSSLPPPPFFPWAFSRGGAESDAASTALPSRSSASRRANVSASAAFILNLKQWRQVDLRSL